jgi:hypothetical protein
MRCLSPGLIEGGCLVCRSVYLPDGSRWVDAWDGTVYDGGMRVELLTPMHKIPIFVRSGADVRLPGLQELYEECLDVTRDEPDIGQLQEYEDFLK